MTSSIISQQQKRLTGKLQNELDFSLVIGGPLYQLFRKAHLADDALQQVHRRIVLFVAVCWLPLLLFSLLEGRLLVGVKVPFLGDVEAHVRFLIVIPLLLVAELVVHRRMRPIVLQFLERHLIDDADMQTFEEAISSTMRLRNSVAAEIGLILFVYIVGVSVIWRGYTALEVDTWYSVSTSSGRSATMAGLWFGLVSLPIFQFLLVRWYFRIAIWTRFLWKVSRLNLRLMPLHPDGSGGIGFLSTTAYAFIPLLMAHGALLSGFLANWIFHLGERLIDFKLEILILVVFLVFLVEAPLLVFAPQLAQAKRAGAREFGALAQRYVREFDDKWMRGNKLDGEQLVGSADIQSLADMGS